MADETKPEEVKVEKAPDSNIYGASVRGWLVIFMVLTMCIMSYLKIAIEEPLYSSIILGLGFYFGQKTK